MKKIVFVCYGMGIGGIEKCLATLINAIDQSKYKIYLAAMNPEYEMLSQITAGFTLLDFDKYFINTTDTINSIKNSDDIPQKIIKLLRYIAFRICVKLNYKPWKLIKKLPGEFDIAVAYSQNGLTPYYVIDRVKEKRKYYGIMI